MGPSAVFTSVDVNSTVYELPLEFHKQGLDAKILSRLGLGDRQADLRPWQDFLGKFNNPRGTVVIGVMGRQNFQDDCYKSVRESLLHAAVSAHNMKLEIRKIEAESLEAVGDVSQFFEGLDGLLIPDSYGQRGFLGMLAGVKYAREHKLPYLGINSGMQLMAIEAARNILGWQDADSTEFVQSSTHPVISLPEEQVGLAAAGIMRLGAATIQLEGGSRLAAVYDGAAQISERHRSKYAFDRRYTQDMADCGLVVAATAQDGLVEAFEWQDHPWGIGVQFHPEFTSRPTKPHPLFVSFVAAALKK